jgi:hypothetical protein
MGIDLVCGITQTRLLTPAKHAARPLVGATITFF